MGDLLAATGIESMTPTEREETLLDLGDLIFRSTLVRLIERMDEKTQEDFNAFLDTNPSEEAVTAFLTERVPGAEEVVRETVDELRNDILGATG
jgi:hypothetical protein